MASRHASEGDLPRRIISTMVWPPEILMFSSPFPVEPAAPTSLSTKQPAPMIGESPTRPGIFHASPEVVVVAEMSPLASTAMQGIVPVGGCAITFWIWGSHAHFSGVSKITAICWLYPSIEDFCTYSGLSIPGRQLNDVEAFHASHASRE